MATETRPTQEYIEGLQLKIQNNKTLRDSAQQAASLKDAPGWDAFLAIKNKIVKNQNERITGALRCSHDQAAYSDARRSQFAVDAIEELFEYVTGSQKKVDGFSRTIRDLEQEIKDTQGDVI